MTTDWYHYFTYTRIFYVEKRGLVEELVLPRSTGTAFAMLLDHNHPIAVQLHDSRLKPP